MYTYICAGFRVSGLGLSLCLSLALCVGDDDVTDRERQRVYVCLCVREYTCARKCVRDRCAAGPGGAIFMFEMEPRLVYRDMEKTKSLLPVRSSFDSKATITDSNSQIFSSSAESVDR